MTKIVYDRQTRVLLITLSEKEAVADETIEEGLSLAWDANGGLVDVAISDVDAPEIEWI